MDRKGWLSNPPGTTGSFPRLKGGGQQGAHFSAEAGPVGAKMATIPGGDQPGKTWERSQVNKSTEPR